MTDIFYNTRHLTLAKKRKILKEAKNLSYDWWVDTRTDKSWSRQKIEMSFDDIMKKLDKECIFRIIHRWIDFKTEKPYLEIAFCTMKGMSYYLWICLDLTHLNYFIKNYHLKINN